SDDRAHRAAHEGEEKAPPGDGPLVDAAAAYLDGFAGARRLLRRGNTFGVGLAIDESERIRGLEVSIPFFEAAPVEHELAPARRPELVMLSALRAHLVVCRESVRRLSLAATVALAKNAFAERPLVGRVKIGGLLLGPRRHRGPQYTRTGVGRPP